VAEVCACFVDVHVFRRRRGPDGKARDEWLVMKRAPHVRVANSWQMVSGTIEEGEKAYQAAYRELVEETGLRPVHFYQASTVNRFYLAATDQVILSPVFAAEVAADADVRLSDEHVAFEWVGAAEAMERFPWPGQRRSLAIVREQFIERDARPESLLDSLLPGYSPTG
jgi:dATP pyrophosphohydrolase